MDNIHTDWFKDAVIYQIYPRSFKDSNGDGFGDINGIISKLDYLKELGVNCIWLSPIYDSPQEDNGYDISNYRDIYQPFGTLEDAKRMIKEMHNRGIRLIMDLVVNHTSSEHPWFKSALSDVNSPYRDYYIIRKGKNKGKKPPTNWGGFFGGSTWERIGETEDYYLHLFTKGQPDLNWENEKVRQEVKDILKFWLDLGVDGFRCDVITLISKKQTFKSSFPMVALTGKDNFVNGPRLHEFLHELYTDVYANYDSMTVGETVLSSLDDAILLTSPEREELSMIFNFDNVDVDNYFGVKWFKRKFSLKRWKRIYKKWQLGLEGKGWNSLFVENHDQRRSIGRFGTTEGEHRVASSKSLAATYFLMKGTPFIYQGQEIGMANPHFKDLNDFKDVETHNINALLERVKPLKLLLSKERLFEYSRDSARTPMLWDDSIYGGFSDVEPWIKPNADKSFNVKSALENKDSLFYFYKSLINIKKGYKVVKDGKYIPLYMNDSRVFAYLRETESESLLVVSSFSDKEIKRKWLSKYQDYQLLLSNYDEHDNVSLKPYETRIYYKKR